MSGGLGKKLFSGLFYTAIAKYLGLVISLGVMMVLARMLSPKEFGTIAIASIFISFFSVVTTVGIGPAIVQNKELGDKNIKDIFSFTFYLAIFLSLIFIVSIPFFVQFYDGDNLLRNVFYLLSINIFFSVVTIVPNALIMKAKKFRFISIRTIVIQVLTGVLAVYAAFKGLGIYSLLINPILGSIFIFIASYLHSPVRLSFSFEKASIRKILSFSIYQMLFNVIYLIYRNIDKILIGKYFNMSILGYYEKSYRLMMLPLENVSNVINPVLHPILSDFQNDTKFIFSSYCRIVKLLANFGFLLTVFLFFNSKELILLFFGEQWYPSIPVFKILSLSVGIQIAQSPVGAIFQAINHVKGLTFASIIVLLLTITAIFVGIYQGSVENVAWYLLLAIYMGYVIYNLFLCKYFNTNILTMLSLLIKPLLLSIGLVIILYLIEPLISDIKSNIILVLIKGSILAIYTLFLIVFGFFDDLPMARRLRHFLLRK